MATIMGSAPLPHYEMQTQDDVANAQIDLVGKVCEYLTRRLALYYNNINVIEQEDLDSVKNEDEAQPRHFVTAEGWSTLFHAEPLAHGRRVCSYLYVVVSYTTDFWRGCSEDDFLRLVVICHPVQGQPQNLTRKHFLFFKYLFAYLDYVEDVVQRTDFPQFDETEELNHFLNMLVSTQFLMNDLLDMSITPIGKQRTKLREHADTLYDAVVECADRKDGFRRAWRNVRGNITTAYLHPSESCEKGHFDVLGFRRLPAVPGQIQWSEQC